MKKYKHGFVYLIKSGETYKIGKAKRIDDRMSSISPVLPHPIELIHSIERDEYDALELELHERFADKRLNGEWFALTEQDIEAIKAIK